MRMAGLESVVLGTCLEITRDDQEIFTAVLAHLGAPGCMLRVFPSCSQLDFVWMGQCTCREAAGLNVSVSVRKSVLLLIELAGLNIFLP